jgi:hypothetical protein
LNRPVVPGVIAFCGWLGFALARWQVWAQGHVNRFIMAGHVYTHGGQLPRGLMLVPAAGYDGQFYYRLALDPANWNATAFGITMDQSYRYARIGYPALAWLLSLGQHHLVPVVLVVINLLAVAAMAVLGGIFARASGRHALWGLAFAAYFGLVISVGRDTAEPLAEACMLGGLLAYRRRSRAGYLLATILFTFGAITRETILLAPAAIAVTRLVAMARRRSRPGLPDLVWVVPAAAYGLLEIAVYFVVQGDFPLLANGSRNLTVPFTAMVDALGYDIAHINTSHLSPVDIALLEYATVAIFVLAGLAVLFVTTAPAHEPIAFVFFVLQLGLLSSQTWTSTFGDGRSLIEPYLMALVLLIATPRRYLSWRYLGLIVACAGPALLVVARRRILYMLILTRRSTDPTPWLAEPSQQVGVPDHDGVAICVIDPGRTAEGEHRGRRAPLQPGGPARHEEGGVMPGRVVVRVIGFPLVRHELAVSTLDDRADLDAAAGVHSCAVGLPVASQAVAEPVRDQPAGQALVGGKNRGLRGAIAERGQIAGREHDDHRHEPGSRHPYPRQHPVAEDTACQRRAERKHFDHLARALQVMCVHADHVGAHVEHHGGSQGGHHQVSGAEQPRGGQAKRPDHGDHPG